MARPDKLNADYFPHLSSMRNDKKLRPIRKKYGLEGYAVYSMILESLCEQDFLCLSWDNLEAKLMSDDFEIEVDRLIEIVDMMIEYELLYLHENILYSSSLDRRIEVLVFVKRASTLTKLRAQAGIDLPEKGAKRALKQFPVVSGSLTPLNPPKGSLTPLPEIIEETTRKVKHSKVKEKKVKNKKSTAEKSADTQIQPDSKSVTKKKKQPDFIDQLLDVFCEEYESVREMDFEITNREAERSAIGKILERFKKKYENQGLDSQGTIASFRDFFHYCVSIPRSTDKFIYENMRPSIILNQLQKIKILMAEGESNGQGATLEQIDAIINKHFPDE